MISDKQTLLQTKNLKKHFPITRKSIIRKKTRSVKALDGISFEVFKGETLGLVGESGCGKSTTGRTILQLYRPTSGEISFDNIDLITQKGKDLRRLRRRMQMISQDPYSSLNPRMTVSDIIGEPLIVHDIAKGKECQERVQELLNVVGMNPYIANRYPHELSGGQRQRIAIARALLKNAPILLLDEATSSLDNITEKEVQSAINILMKNRTSLIVAHRLTTIENADLIYVIDNGKIVEKGKHQDLIKNNGLYKKLYQENY